MNVFDDLREKAKLSFSEWIKIRDFKSKWTIEDFSYTTGVDEVITKPHCWRCVTVNHCWFVNQENKKPKEFDYSKYPEIPPNKRGLYHPNGHCIKISLATPNKNQIKFIIPVGKIEWMIKDKGHTLREMGYQEDEFIDAVEIIKNLIAEEFVKGNYTFKEHDKHGYRIGFVLEQFPGKHEDHGKFYKLKTGWTIFPNGKLKCNTLIGGLKK